LIKAIVNLLSKNTPYTRPLEASVQTDKQKGKDHKKQNPEA